MKYRAGAYDKGSKTRGKYMVVNATSKADAMIMVKPLFPAVPLQRFFAFESEAHDTVDNRLHPFTVPKQSKGAQ